MNGDGKAVNAKGPRVKIDLSLVILHLNINVLPVVQRATGHGPLLGPRDGDLEHGKVAKLEQARVGIQRILLKPKRKRRVIGKKPTHLIRQRQLLFNKGNGGLPDCGIGGLLERALIKPGCVPTNQQSRTAELAPGGGLAINNPMSFGVDACGEILITDQGGGTQAAARAAGAG